MIVGTALRPQLAGQCHSFDKAVAMYPSGFYCEVKYDGERLMAHMARDRTVSFFSRQGKTPPEHKTAGLADALRLAFPNASELIVDSEVVMRAPDGTVLPFGAQGVHEQKKHAGATCCLLAFDLLHLDGSDLTQLPLRKRRAALEGALVPQRHRVELSSCRLMSTAAELASAFAESEASKLEGLMIKDVRSRYVPGDRKLWHKLKRDYLPQEQCAAAGLRMADSVDLVVLGAFLGSGAKTHLLSSFLMGCWNEQPRSWQLVCKLSNGFTNARLDELTTLLTTGGNSPMVRLDAAAALPAWMPASAKGLQRPTHVLRKAPHDCADSIMVFEVRGTEFTTGSKAAGSTVSIRFPRLVRERDDKGLHDATNATELADLVALGANGAKANSLVTIAALAPNAGGCSIFSL